MASKKFIADALLKTLIEDLALTQQRALLLIYNDPNCIENDIGNKAMVIHHLLAKYCDERPSVLWCHKKNSETPQVSRKVLKRLEKDLKQGKRSLDASNAFSIFLLSTQVTFCSLDSTKNVLGRTFGMCVIQDFEALTPNVLCHVVETVRGGGVVVGFLPQKISGLRDLFTLPMDVHSKLRTYLYPDLKPRFNERFVLSLAWCKTCLILDSGLQVQAELANQKHFRPLMKKGEAEAEEKKMTELLNSLEDAEKPLPQLVRLCRTVDQAKALLKMIDVLTEKSGRSTVSLTAARGRGKSAALGLATAASIYFGVSNIYVSSPSPRNLGTFFEFVCKGLDSLEYEEHRHYELLQATNPEFQKAIVRINIFAKHRQTVQYLCPTDSHRVSEAELVIIDEAASIPLARVKAMLGRYNVFMASTINGYEGTGRSLSLKLLKELRRQTAPIGATASAAVNASEVALTNCRPLFEVTLESSIRYPPNDPVEKWLNRLLCLDAPSFVPPITHCPHADTCDLYAVNRDVLLSGHSETEGFLRQVLSLLVSSHYKNSPDDLQILSDAPAHKLFVLLPPIDHQKASAIPSVFAVLQVAIEGGIPRSTSEPVLNRGEHPPGDLIPWTLASHFLTAKFTKLKGVRVVRVASHPDYQSMGYGSRTIRLLKEFYEGRFLSLEDVTSNNDKSPMCIQEDDNSRIGPRPMDEPLLVKLSEMKPETLAYIGVSYGLNEPLLKFWKKLDFFPLYISQAPNKMTGEHTCIMVHPLSCDTFSLSAQSSLPKWLKAPTDNFFRRFLTLLGGVFRKFPHTLALCIVTSFKSLLEENEIEWATLEPLISGPDMKRIESYAKNLSERHLVTDLLPPIASLFFSNRLPALQISATQATILLGSGLQFSLLEDVGRALDLPVASTLGQFNRMMKRTFKALSEVQEKCIIRQLSKEVLEHDDSFNPVTISLEDDLDLAAQEFANQPGGLHPMLENLEEFAVKGGAEDWEHVMQNPGRDVVTIKSAKRAARMSEAELERELTAPSKKRKENQPKGKHRGNKRR